MALEQLSEDRLKDVNPALADKIRKMADMLEPEGILIRVAQAQRTWAEQHALYEQGRTTPGKIVTNADAGHSWHNLGCAVDCVPMSIDHTIDWNADHPQWKRMEAVGVSLGLTSGANWIRIVDAPHFQITGRFPVGAPDDEARRLYQDSGAEAFWAEVNKG